MRQASVETEPNRVMVFASSTTLQTGEILVENILQDLLPTHVANEVVCFENGSLIGSGIMDSQIVRDMTHDAQQYEIAIYDNATNVIKTSGTGLDSLISTQDLNLFFPLTGGAFNGIVTYTTSTTVSPVFMNAYSSTAVKTIEFQPVTTRMIPIANLIKIYDPSNSFTLQTNGFTYTGNVSQQFTVTLLFTYGFRFAFEPPDTQFIFYLNFRNDDSLVLDTLPNIEVPASVQRLRSVTYSTVMNLNQNNVVRFFGFAQTQFTSTIYFDVYDFALIVSAA